MTSLRNKIIRNFVGGIFACILVFSIAISYLLSIYTKNFLATTEDNMPLNIKKQFESLLTDNDVYTMKERLGKYSKALNIDIEILDKNNEPVMRFKGRNDNENPLTTTKSYDIINPNLNDYRGQLIITYDTGEMAANELLNNFRNSIIIAIVMSLTIGIIIALVLSTNITNPIKQISDATLKIKDGDYDINLKESKIIELENLQNNIRYLSRNLKNQKYVRKQYAQDISHELRTPITNLQLYIEAIKDGVIDVDEQTLSSLLEETHRLEGLVVNLNKSFNDNSEYLKINKKEFDLSQHIKLILDTIKPRLTKLDISLIEEIKDGVMIYSDKDKISQIIQNLISNAIKAIKEDGLIRVSLYEDKNNIYIDIKDNGVGISDEKKEVIFERFYRIDDARNTKTNGHGLGLSITKNFVESLGGKIKLKSKLGKGSTFSVIFPK
ncbi:MULTISPECIES: cell wall metabolism sensor histidine kinase WalK [Anaerococcus]|uniref:histidine kinase n=1 Tax=Anaerococcus obesiensis TaxID=1287640 RepID=A0A7T7UTS5_9FIRM|nr:MULTISPECIES: HAMP domain-containing sensor histidine kinase [Anaerococcus]MDD7765662.1 HAMP domain-containing sensor histidine kinase [Anaerococcus vaginalis]MDU1030569.1 HAMP domain-containing sensor histidine kinase [Anaerococcus vaginalis]MDU5559603.1 HAMP domain-containing sensor histidine kinase [Anaerococcus vaginalis]MDY6127827.1 HAMP domain-containing sensor histidine kinase [Anaerococcus sp.]QQN56073.1 HAMP domain-containing histidine kinase [Anaerococcus obesiensis]